MGLKGCLLGLSVIFVIMAISNTISANLVLGWGNRVFELDLFAGVFYIISAILVMFYLIIPEE